MSILSKEWLMAISTWEFLKIYLLFCCCVVNSAYADSKVSRSILEQYSISENNIHGYTEGIIDGEHYAAFIANKLYPKEVSSSAIFLLAINKDKSRSEARIDLRDDARHKYTMKIKNDSLFIYHSLIHYSNKWYDIRHQFKRVNQKFRIVGTDEQIMELSCLSQSCRTEDILRWYGASYNFLSTTTICWKETVDLTAEQKAKATRERYENRYEQWVQPKKGMRHQMKLPEADLLLLDGFNLLKFPWPDSCHFDGNNRLVK